MTSEKETVINQYHFLSGDGEMRKLIREFNWKNTPVGAPEAWPQSLRTIVALILSSKFPMFLWWGADLIQFYNDAYRPSLGYNGKHPAALGQKGKDCWPEIWNIIYPLIDQVMTTGEATWSEDQLVPIYRNGKIEDVYWTFSYSPVINDSGNIAGVLVVCHETTEKITNLKQLEENKNELLFAIEAAELGTWDFQPAINKFTGNQRLIEWFGLHGETEIDFSAAIDSIAEKDRPRVIAAIQHALSYSSGGHYDIDYTIVHPETKAERIIKAKGRAWFGEDRTAYRFNGTMQDITEQKKAEAEMQKLITIVEASHEFIGLFAPDTKALYSNPAALAMLGWDNVTGKTIADCIYPEDLPLLDKLLAKLLEKGNFSQEIRFVNAQTGEPFWMQWDAFTIKDPLTGEVMGLATVSPNITEHKQAEKALKDSEQQLLSFIDSAPFPIGIYTGKEMRIEFANQAILAVWGKGENVLGKTYAEILPELKNSGIFEELNNVYATGIAFHARNQRVDILVNGSLQKFYFNYSFTPLYTPTGKIYGVMNTAADITDLVLAKQKVEESENNIRNTILQAPVAMCIFRGPRHVVEIANTRMIALWGKDEAAVMNRPVFEGLPEARDQGYETLLDEVYTTGKTFLAYGAPVTLPRNGHIEVVYVNFVYEAFREPDGRISGILAVATDVTEQILARQKIEEVVAERTKELAQANSELQRSNAELAQFAYIASHDLQEPLRKITTFAQMLERSLGNSNEQAKSYLDRISNASIRMLALIRDVLTYSQLSRETDVFKPVSIAQIIENIKTDFELLIEQKGATIEYKNLPTIEAIPLQMSQLFGNLLSNALKFSKQDVRPVITITGTLLSEEVVSKHLIPARNTTYYNIEFKDNGIGFRQEYAAQIFNIFQRLHGKTEYAGTGIGLAMCKKVALNHHGDIYAVSDTGTGATFNVILPERQGKR